MMVISFLCRFVGLRILVTVRLLKSEGHASAGESWHYLVKHYSVETCGLIGRVDGVEERGEVPPAECHLGGTAATRGALFGIRTRDGRMGKGPQLSGVKNCIGHRLLSL